MPNTPENNKRPPWQLRDQSQRAHLLNMEKDSIAQGQGNEADPAQPQEEPPSVWIRLHICIPEEQGQTPKSQEEDDATNR